MRVKLIDLPRMKNLKGKRINVRRQGGKYHYDYQDKPLMRIFIEAKVHIEKGVKWLYWYWVPENKDLDYDCGYSGVTISPNHKNSYFNIAA